MGALPVHSLSIPRVLHFALGCPDATLHASDWKKCLRWLSGRHRPPRMVDGLGFHYDTGHLMGECWWLVSLQLAVLLLRVPTRIPVLLQLFLSKFFAHVW